MINISLDTQVTGLGHLYLEPIHEEEMTDQIYAQMMGWA